MPSKKAVIETKQGTIERDPILHLPLPATTSRRRAHRVWAGDEGDGRRQRDQSKRRNHVDSRLVIGGLVVALLLAMTLVVQDSGAFVVRLGNDTLSLEQ